MSDRPYLPWPVFRRSGVAAFARSLTVGCGPASTDASTETQGAGGAAPIGKALLEPLNRFYNDPDSLNTRAMNLAASAGICLMGAPRLKLQVLKVE